jgi:hypothetical protein
MPVRAYRKGLVQQVIRDITLIEEEFNKKTIICGNFRCAPALAAVASRGANYNSRHDVSGPVKAVF